MMGESVLIYDYSISIMAYGCMLQAPGMDLFHAATMLLRCTT